MVYLKKKTRKLDRLVAIKDTENKKETTKEQLGCQSWIKQGDEFKRTQTSQKEFWRDGSHESGIQWLLPLF